MKPIFAAAAVVIAGFAVLATAQAGSIKLNLTQGEKVISSREATPQNCQMMKTWKYDYNGNLYLKKVRVCA
jgi:hypothetical protein